MTERATRDSEIAGRARQWLLSTSAAVLCTRCSDEDLPDWPFGSLAPFALTETGMPIILISEIAEHTRNLVKDPRAALFVSDPAAEGDPQASWRLTILGHARRVRARSDERAAGVPGAEDALVLEDDAFRALHARYSARVPDAPRYFEAHRFGYWQLEPLRVRAIGGFGAIHWLEGDAILRDPLGGGLAEASNAILEHMNDDHEAALLDIAGAAAAPRATSARMVGLDRAGFLVETRSPDALRYVEFGKEIHAADARAVFVELTQAARACLAAGTTPASASAEPRTLRSEDLLAGADMLRIEHRGAQYLLRITRHGRMILTK